MSTYINHTSFTLCIFTHCENRIAQNGCDLRCGKQKSIPNAQREYFGFLPHNPFQKRSRYQKG